MVNRHILTAGLAASLLAFASPAAADPTLYLRQAPPVTLASGEQGTRLISPEGPSTELQRTEGIGIQDTDTSQFPEFISAAPQIDRILVPPASAVLYLGTHEEPMIACAEVFVDVFARNPVRRVPVASGSATPTIVQLREGALLSPITVELAPVGTWHLDSGDGLELTIRVRNTCGEHHGVVLFYDAISQPSGLVFPDDPASGPGFVDNCPGISNPDQKDSNGDGVGDACQSTEVVAQAVCASCGCNELACQDGGICTDLSCGSSGCQRVQVVWADVIGCLIEQLRTAISAAAPKDVSPRLARPGSPLRIALTRSDKALRAIRGAIARHRSRAKIIKRRQRLARALTRFTATVTRLQHRRRVSAPLQASLAEIAQQASAATSRFRP